MVRGQEKSLWPHLRTLPIGCLMEQNRWFLTKKCQTLSNRTKKRQPERTKGRSVALSPPGTIGIMLTCCIMTCCIMLTGQNSRATFIQWCWWCRGCELLQRHSDIKVKGCRRYKSYCNIGKVYCGNSQIAKLKATHIPGSNCSLSKNHCWIFWYLLFFNAVCVFVLFK